MWIYFSVGFWFTLAPQFNILVGFKVVSLSTMYIYDCCASTQTLWRLRPSEMCQLLVILLGFWKLKRLCDLPPSRMRVFWVFWEGGGCYTGCIALGYKGVLPESFIFFVGLIYLWGHGEVWLGSFWYVCTGSLILFIYVSLLNCMKNCLYYYKVQLYLNMLSINVVEITTFCNVWPSSLFASS